jgi:hypothetical protein
LESAPNDYDPGNGRKPTRVGHQFRQQVC